MHDYILKDKGDIFIRLMEKLKKVSKIIVGRRKSKTIWVAIIITVLILSVIIISGILLFIFGVISRG